MEVSIPCFHLRLSFIAWLFPFRRGVLPLLCRGDHEPRVSVPVAQPFTACGSSQSCLRTRKPTDGVNPVGGYARTTQWATTRAIGGMLQLQAELQIYRQRAHI